MTEEKNYILKELKELRDLYNSTLDEEECRLASDSEIDSSTETWNRAMNKLGELIKIVEEDKNA
ncbi:hypothetical protein H8D29_03500 [PVC group bacterium]|nr:hypothetical protein [PVC group bacterium]